MQQAAYRYVIDTQRRMPRLIAALAEADSLNPEAGIYDAGGAECWDDSSFVWSIPNVFLIHNAARVPFFFWDPLSPSEESNVSTE